ncbi:hypothetical protein ACTVQ6_15345 [Klebsiella pneumoniae]|uniref:hypothetical protein n=1 Tax=Klebsiella pneumoniae TaxID=573 RepID=UPI000BBBF5B7|nr:hypothetical protein [Klebsiella pneumoniae]PCE36955.1 hypothetical protein CI706_14455 [Klebsiella pneumoniae subsp. pneumoniae]HCT7999723.1 hypothetical protein [Klebsiella pneumoniae]
MAFTVTRKVKTMTLYPELAIRIPGEEKEIEVTYTPLYTSGVNGSIATVIFDINTPDAESSSRLDYSFEFTDPSDLVTQAESALKAALSAA